MRRLRQGAELQPVWITGIGTHLPERVLTNQEIETGMPWLDTTAQWIEEHVGIQQRHVVGEGEKATDLGFQAAQQALEAAGMDPGRIELLVHATNTPEEAFPAGAARIQAMFGKSAETGRLHMHRAGCFDLQQGCASFLAGVRLASSMVATGEIETALVTGADVSTRMLDWTDRSTCILLGDAACAAVVTSRGPGKGAKGPHLRYLAGHMQTDASLADAIRRTVNLPRHNDPFKYLAERNGHSLEEYARSAREKRQECIEESPSPYMLMSGRDVYRFVKRTVVRSGYVEVMRRSGLMSDAEEKSLAQIDRLEELSPGERIEVLEMCASRVGCLIPHNANLNLNIELAEQMRIPLERTYLNIAKYGNTSAASIGLAIDEALRIPAEYATLPRRDEHGEVSVPARSIVVPPLVEGQVAMLLSFGAGNSWNYVLVRHEG